jgi:hypothetical protein
VHSTTGGGFLPWLDAAALNAHHFSFKMILPRQAFSASTAANSSGPCFITHRTGANSMVHIVCVTGHGSALGCCKASDELSFGVVEQAVQPAAKTRAIKTNIQLKLKAFMTINLSPMAKRNKNASQHPKGIRPGHQILGIMSVYQCSCSKFAELFNTASTSF